jgi:hypothetical protein
MWLRRVLHGMITHLKRVRDEDDRYQHSCIGRRYMDGLWGDLPKVTVRNTSIFQGQLWATFKECRAVHCFVINLEEVVSLCWCLWELFLVGPFLKHSWWTLPHHAITLRASIPRRVLGKKVYATLYNKHWMPISLTAQQIQVWNIGLCHSLQLPRIFGTCVFVLNDISCTW